MRSWDPAQAWRESVWARVVLAVCSGLLTVLAFPNWFWGSLAFVALVPLLLALRGVSPRHGFALGLAWGMAFFLGALYWVTYVMVTYGGVALPLAIFAWVGLAVILAGYPALFGWAVAHLRDVDPTVWALGVSATWVAVEFLRSHLLTGFPWVLLGYSQGASIELIQAARLTGVYGLSFLVVLVNGAFAVVAFPGRAPWRRAVPGAVAAILLGGAVVYSRGVLRDPPPYRTVTVGIVQGNIDQGLKWNAAIREATVAKYRRLTLDVGRQQPALVVWPEAAMPFLLRTDRWLGPQVLDVAREARIPLLVGAPDQVGPGRYTNSAFLITGDGEIAGRYDKRHLVPFGEYVPLKSLFFFLDKLVVGIGDFVPGRGEAVFQGPFGRFSVLICYEAIFPDEVRRDVRDGAEFLVNITNDAWFGRTSAPHQHLAMAALRAVENNVYVVRAANTGISAIIEPSGRIAKASDLYADAAFVGRIRPGGGRTFYTRYGNVFAWLCLVATGALLAAAWRGARGA